MNLWCVSMECAGIAEAGGVKNVTYSLCKEFSLLGHNVTLFIPSFKCTQFNLLQNIQKDFFSSQLKVCNKNETVSYTKALFTEGNFQVILINHKCFAEKEAVYTYTEHEQKLNPDFIKGSGHLDSPFMDILFQKSVFEYFIHHQNEQLPQIIHCQDASTAVLPAFFHNIQKQKLPQFVVTIHNAGPFYHHEFKNLEQAEYFTSLPDKLLKNSMNSNKVEPFLIAANVKAKLTTVSPEYAKELVNPAFHNQTDGLSTIFASKKIKITGITNGFDFERYNPKDKNCSKLPYEFDPSSRNLAGKFLCREYFLQNVVQSDNFDTTGIKKYGLISQKNGIFIAYHGRITTQKGISVLTSAIPNIIRNFDDVHFVIAGQGETELENKIIELTKKYSQRVFFINGYNQKVVRLATASCDFMVLPSFFEPCGLEDFIAQSYGTLPIAHKTGGLNKIIDNKTGFLYKDNTPEALTAKLSEVIMIKKLKPNFIISMIKKASDYIYREYLWKNVIEKKYIPFFEKIQKF